MQLALVTRRFRLSSDLALSHASASLFKFQNASTNCTSLREVTFRYYGSRIRNELFTCRPLSCRLNTSKTMIRATTPSYVPFLFPLLPLLSIWKTLLRLMNQANQNSDDPAAISSRLSSTHTIKQLDHLNVFFMLSRIFFCVFARAAETELAPSPASFTYVMSARAFHPPAR